MTTLDDVIETVRAAREDGPEALAAMALSYGATMVLGSVRVGALRGRVAATRAERDQARADLAEERGHVSEIETDYARFAEAVWEALGRTPPADIHTRAGHAVGAVTELRAERDEAREGWRIAIATITQAAEERDDAAAEAERLRVELNARTEQLGAVTMERDRARAAAAPAVAGWKGATAGWASAAADAERLQTEVYAARERLGTANRERDALRIALDAAASQAKAAEAEAARLRALPTYDARTIRPTTAERKAHHAADGSWLAVVTTPQGDRAEVLRGWEGDLPLGTTYIPLGPNRLPCAWPVVAAEGGA